MDSTPVMRELWVAERKAASEEKVRAAGNEIISDFDKTPFMAKRWTASTRKHVTDPALQDLVARIQAVD
jgi:hypothetical protein